MAAAQIKDPPELYCLRKECYKTAQKRENKAQKQRCSKGWTAQLTAYITDRRSFAFESKKKGSSNVREAVN